MKTNEIFPLGLSVFFDQAQIPNASSPPRVGPEVQMLSMRARVFAIRIFGQVTIFYLKKSFLPLLMESKVLKINFESRLF